MLASAAVAAAASAVNGVLATPSGATLYTSDKDVANSGKSTCNAQCATNWPPLAAQASDAASGDTSGDGKGSVWHVIKN